MKNSILTILLLLSLQVIYSQNYAVSLIPDSLKKDAFVVIRNDTKEVVLTDVNKGTAKHKEAYTILNKIGEEQAYLVVFYDKESSVTINSITMYDEFGEKIRKIKSTEIIDVPAYSGALFADNRVKAFKPDYAKLPYTIEYEYEVSSSNMISQGVWSPYSNYNQSVQSSKLSITFPKSVTLNRKEFGMNAIESETKSGDKLWIWESQHLKAIINEPYSTSFIENVPNVYLMPSVIKWDKYEGLSNNWKEYGLWAYNLYNGKSELCEEEKIKVKELLKNTNDTLEQIKSLYKYMQERTRYVGIQVGIGGWQPFDAKTVYETGYGDCKALTNYMHSLLKFAGIKSHPALVGSGRYIEPILMDFPNFHQFDHVILSVPLSKDTLWLETTSQMIPFGFLGDFTDNRDVLLLTNEGGKFAHTPKYTVNENKQTSIIDLKIDTLGCANINITTSYKALKYDEITKLFYLNTDEQKKWLYENCEFPSPQINSFKISENKNIIPDATIIQDITSRNYATFSGNYMIFPINVADRIEPLLKMTKPRNSEIILERDNNYNDSITIEFPASYKIESLPQNKTIQSKFGTYNYAISSTDNKIIYKRNLIIYRGRHAAADYKDFYDTILAISKADGIKIMVIKN